MGATEEDVRMVSRILVMLALSAAIKAPASAAVIDFDSLTTGGNTVANVGMTYEESGYVFSVVGGSLPFVTFGSGEVRYGGSAALYNNNDNGLTRLTRSDGEAFTILSIDLAGDTRFAPTIPVSFVGTRTDGGLVNMAVGVASSVLTTYYFSDSFADLVALEWRQVTPYHQFDRLVLEAQTTSVPEPGVSTLLPLAVALGLRRYRRRLS